MRRNRASIRPDPEVSSPTDPTVRIHQPSAPETPALTLAELLKAEAAAAQPVAKPAPQAPVKEIGGRQDGPEPTRYGDWEKNGRCIDF